MPLGAPKSTKRAPKRPPGAPKMSPREPPNIVKSSFRSQTLIFQKSSSRQGEIKVFDGGRVNLGSQNRHRDKKKQRFKMHVGRLGSCLGLLRAPRGARWGFKGAQIKRFENSGRHLEPAQTPKEPPRGPQEHQKQRQANPQTF